jgi:hypothetical protein
MERVSNDNDVGEVHYQILTPSVVSVTTAVSKTTEFDWKLTKLPKYLQESEIIKFQTGALVDAVFQLEFQILIYF